MSEEKKNNSFLDRIKKKKTESDGDEGDGFSKKHNQGDGGFADRFQKKPAMTSSKLDNVAEEEPDYEKKPIDPKKRALAKYIYLVKGIDAGKKAWYYVLVEALKVQLFLKALNDDIIHLEHYGKILYSAYGEEPPAHITKALKDEYGID